MKYLVVLKCSAIGADTPIGTIEKFMDFATRAEADAHLANVIGDYPQAFIVDNPPSFASGYETAYPTTKTITVDSARELADQLTGDWKDSMQATDSTCPRWFEDYVTENSVALAPGKSKESYDAKVLLRSNKPL